MFTKKELMMMEPWEFVCIVVGILLLIGAGVILAL